MYENLPPNRLTSWLRNIQINALIFGSKSLHPVIILTVTLSCMCMLHLSKPFVTTTIRDDRSTYNYLLSAQDTIKTPGGTEAPYMPGDSTTNRTQTCINISTPRYSQICTDTVSTDIWILCEEGAIINNICVV